jgi:hypothetical protein
MWWRNIRLGLGIILLVEGLVRIREVSALIDIGYGLWLFWSVLDRRSALKHLLALVWTSAFFYTLFAEGFSWESLGIASGLIVVSYIPVPVLSGWVAGWISIYLLKDIGHLGIGAGLLGLSIGLLGFTSFYVNHIVEQP